MIIAYLILACLIAVKQCDGAHTWDKSVAIRHLYYSYAAYSPASQLKDWSCAYCVQLSNAGSKVQFLNLLENSTLKTQAFLALDLTYKQIILSFRGSDNIQNWIHNLQFLKADTVFENVPNAYTTNGFYKDFLSLAPQTRTAISNSFEYIAKDSKTFGNLQSWTLVITGHSLGGALASLFMLDQAYNFGVKDNVTLISTTFGSPRVGDPGFASQYSQSVGDGMTLRVTHDHDPVPHLPTNGMGFQHLTQEIWEVPGSASKDPENDVYLQCSLTNGEDPTCSFSLVVALNVADHLDYMGFPLHDSAFDEEFIPFEIESI